MLGNKKRLVNSNDITIVADPAPSISQPISLFVPKKTELRLISVRSRRVTGSLIGDDMRILAVMQTQSAGSV